MTGATESFLKGLGRFSATEERLTVADWVYKASKPSHPLAASLVAGLFRKGQN